MFHIIFLKPIGHEVLSILMISYKVSWLYIKFFYTKIPLFKHQLIHPEQLWAIYIYILLHETTSTQTQKSWCWRCPSITPLIWKFEKIKQKKTLITLGFLSCALGPLEVVYNGCKYNVFTMYMYVIHIWFVYIFYNLVNLWILNRSNTCLVK